MAKTITYVKYPNRRIYDTESSGYVSFQDIRKKLMEGSDIIVLDNKTKEDVTREVLISILMDETSGGEALFSEELMKAIICFYGNPMQHLFTATLDQSHKLLNSMWSMPISKKSEQEEK
jgi:polyhydroxyalkanoate synthesis repressor PhaR